MKNYDDEHLTQVRTWVYVCATLVNGSLFRPGLWTLVRLTTNKTNAIHGKHEL